MRANLEDDRLEPEDEVRAILTRIDGVVARVGSVAIGVTGPDAANMRRWLHTLCQAATGCSISTTGFREAVARVASWRPSRRN